MSGADDSTGRGGPPMRVAFQGVTWAYSHLAARRYLASLGLEGDFSGHRTFAAALGTLLCHEADLAVLPIENTTSGSIHQVVDLLRSTELHVVGEETWKVDHCLAGPSPVPLASLRRVLSHPQGLEQCAKFLASLGGVTPVPYHDTAEAMLEVAKAGDSTQAAIGSPEAARAHGLHVLAERVADQAENWTRFVVVARDEAPMPADGPAKTSLVMTTRHEHGALARCLAVLAEHGMQLTKLDSRPRPGQPWEYLFFLDFESATASAADTAIEKLRGVALDVKRLGTYPARVRAAGGEAGAGR